MKHQDKEPISIVVFSERMTTPIFLRHKIVEDYNAIIRSIRLLANNKKIPPRFDVRFDFQGPLLEEIEHIKSQDENLCIFWIKSNNRILPKTVGCEVFKKNNQPWGYEVFTVIGENPWGVLLSNLLIFKYFVVKKDIFENDFVKFSSHGVSIDSHGINVDNFQMMCIMTDFRRAILDHIRMDEIDAMREEFNKTIASDFFPKNPVSNEFMMSDGRMFKQGDILSLSIFLEINRFTLNTLFKNIYSDLQFEKYTALKEEHYKSTSSRMKKYDIAYEYLKRTGEIPQSFLCVDSNSSVPADALLDSSIRNSDE